MLKRHWRCWGSNIDPRGCGGIRLIKKPHYFEKECVAPEEAPEGQWRRYKQ